MKKALIPMLLAAAVFAPTTGIAQQRQHDEPRRERPDWREDRRHWVDRRDEWRAYDDFRDRARWNKYGPDPRRYDRRYYYSGPSPYRDGYYD